MKDDSEGRVKGRARMMHKRDTFSDETVGSQSADYRSDPDAVPHEGWQTFAKHGVESEGPNPSNADRVRGEKAFPEK